MNEMCGWDNVFIGLCVCLRVHCTANYSQSDSLCALNANSFKTVKATDFKFDTRVSRVSLDMIP